MGKIVIAVFACVAIGVANGFLAQPAHLRQARQASCPEKNTHYAVTGSCDEYIQCTNGVEEEKQCPDGLLYKEGAGYPCAYPNEVECTSGKIQPAQPTEDCPHQFGFYAIGDSSNCGQFTLCSAGTGFTIDCPTGLAFNKNTYQCDWPDLVEDCDAQSYLKFTCPDVKTSPGLGEPEASFLPSPADCQEYFVCTNGKPRRFRCNAEQAFNSETRVCDDLENVPSCKV